MRRTSAPAAARLPSSPLLQESAPEKEAVETNADETAWPEGKPQGAAAEDTTVGPSEGFDPRVIAYVSLPALVLGGQLFFTFSRDALGDAALGPAIMDGMPPM